MSRIRIYQINLSKDKDRVAFLGRAELEMFQGSTAINSKIYDLVFDGDVRNDSLEDLYRIFNGEYPENYRARSMSVSDVVEVFEDGKSEFFFCDTIGFAKVDFDPQACFRRTGISETKDKTDMSKDSPTR